jgi:Tol biopolymer transport system component
MIRRPTFSVCITLALLAFVSFSTSPTRTAAADDEKKPAKPKPELGPMHTVEFDTDEGTWMNLDVSPDGQTIAFDMLGNIYTMPIAGGDAKVIAAGLPWEEHPRFSPDGKRLAFISDRDGMLNIWTMDPDGSNPKQISHSFKDALGREAWTPDNAALVATKQGWDPESKSAMWMFYTNGGAGFGISAAGERIGDNPEFSHDGRYLYTDGIHRLDRETGEVSNLTLTMDAFLPRLSPDGKQLAYLRKIDADLELRLRDLQTGEERILVRPVDSFGHQMYGNVYPNYAFTPDGSSIIIWLRGKIHRVNVANGSDTVIPFHVHFSDQIAGPLVVKRRIDDNDIQVKFIRWPTQSPDGSKLAFSALGHLWIMDLPNGQPRRLTQTTDTEWCPRFSPDGRWIAYSTWSDAHKGAVKVIAADGSQGRSLTTIPGQYFNPVWSPDGSKVVYVVGDTIEQLAQQPGPIESLMWELRWAPSTGGESQFITHAPYPHWPEQTHQTVSFSADGSRIFFTEDRKKDRSRRVLVSMRLDGTDKKDHMRFLAGDEAVVSPDGKHVAIIRSDNVHVAVLPPFASTLIDLDFKGGTLPVAKITQDGADYVNWLDSKTLTWSFTNHYYKLSDFADAKEKYEPQLVTEVKLTVPQARPNGKIAFRNARIITVKGDEVIEHGTIVVDRNRISAVGPTASTTIPADALVVDATGKTIMPGLVDTHAHLQFNPYEIYPQHKWQYISNLAFGVTSSMDPWSPSVEVFEQRDMVAAGEMMGPRISSTGTVIDGRFDNVDQYVDLETIDSARHLVKRYAGYGAEMLKEYMQPRREQRQYLVQAAREMGVEITAEGGGDMALDLSMVADGYTAFEHTLPIAPLYKDVVQFLAQSKAHYTLTLIVAYGGAALEYYYTGKTNPHEDPKVRRFNPEGRLDDIRHYRFVPEDELFFKTIAASLPALDRAGALTSLGSHGNDQGFGAQWEVWGRATGGLTPLEDIRDCTLSGAQKVGFDQDLGSLEVGKLADFLVLDANPLVDITNTGTLKWTVKNGFVYDSESMAEVWPEFKKLPKFFWQTDEDTKRFAAPEPQPLTEVAGGRKTPSKHSK